MARLVVFLAGGGKRKGADPRPINRNATLRACAVASHCVGSYLHRGPAADTLSQPPKADYRDSSKVT